MEHKATQGRRFSHLYLVPSELLPDSMPMRKRVQRTFAVFCQEIRDIGQHLELEMGIDILRNGPYALYTDWSYFEKCAVEQLLDAVTIIGGKIRDVRRLQFGNFCQQIGRIFLEEHMAYRLDESCGVHPQVDLAHVATMNATIRHLEGAKYSAARAQIERADLSLLPAHNTRDSVRAIFDAAENVFKQTFDGAISLNGASINNNLKPALRQIYGEGTPLRAAQKLADALHDWAEGSHNYRHAEGKPDEVAPPEALAVVALTQGLGFVRWLADINHELANKG